MLQCLGIIFGLVYWQQSINQAGISNINGALFLMQTQMTFGFIFNVVMVTRLTSVAMSLPLTYY